ncbi:hypothetical protein V8C86DRAFT_2560906 [Haematococcus lacustris]
MQQGAADGWWNKTRGRRAGSRSGAAAGLGMNRLPGEPIAGRSACGCCLWLSHWCQAMTWAHEAIPYRASTQAASPPKLLWTYSCSTAQHSTAQHSTAQHSTAQHSTAQHSTAQHSTAHSLTPPYLTSGNPSPSATRLPALHVLSSVVCWRQGGGGPALHPLRLWTAQHQLCSSAAEVQGMVQGDLGSFLNFCVEAPLYLGRPAGQLRNPPGSRCQVQSGGPAGKVSCICSCA